METMKQPGLVLMALWWLYIWWLCISSGGETRKFNFLSQIWPWWSSSIATQNNRDVNQAILHLWFKVGDPSFKGYQVMMRYDKLKMG